MEENRLPTLIFIHIPRTGGTSLIRMFEESFGSQNVLWFKHHAEVESWKEHSAESAGIRFKVFAGHICYGFHRYIPGPAKYVTFLRDPVQRIISIYRFIRKDLSHPHHSDVAEMDLEDFLESAIASEYHNAQTAILAGDDATLPAGNYTGVTARHLKLALERLQTDFFHIGRQDRYQESIEQFNAKSPVKLGDIKHLNKSILDPQQYSISRYLVEKIKQMNEWDVYLWDSAFRR